MGFNEIKSFQINKHNIKYIDNILIIYIIYI